MRIQIAHAVSNAYHWMHGGVEKGRENERTILNRIRGAGADSVATLEMVVVEIPHAGVA